jgi:tetratricopeptide (TPR) repeat protein
VEPPRERAARAWPGAFALALLVVLAHGGALACGFIWDDDDYVLENDTLRTLGGLWRIWTELAATPQYYPLVHTSYWIEYRFFGLNPTAYHATNLALHALGSCLLWRILGLLAVPGAFLAAALFAVHPVHVESVAWITERKNVLSLVFYLASALVFLRRALAAEPPRTWDRRYFASLALFVCALLSKTVTASLPAALLLVLVWKRARELPRRALELAPFFAIGAPLGLLTAWLERSQVGAVGEFWQHSAALRLLVAGRVVWFYAGKLVWPHPLAFIYPRWEVDASQAWQWLYPIAAVAAIAAAVALRRRAGDGLLVALLFFGGTLVPALGFFDVAPMRFSYVADHFQYHASIGLLALFAAGLARAATRVPRAFARAAAVALLAALAILSARQTRVYRDLVTLWSDTVAKNPDGWMPQLNLGHALENAGDLRGAIAHYRRSLALRPGYARANMNLGSALARLGELDAAERHLRAALEVAWPSATAHFDLGNVLKKQRREAEAEAEYRLALQFDPGHAGAHTNLGALLLARGEAREALEHYRAVAQRQPHSAAVQANLASAALALGDRAQAARALAASLRLDPNQPALRAALAELESPR